MQTGRCGVDRRALLRLLAASATIAAAPGAARASIERLFAPSKSIDRRWIEYDDSNPKRVDHAAFDEFLKRYTMRDRAGVVRVRYADVAAADEQRLRRYLARLGEVPVARLSRVEQLAFWINAYNALTLAVVLEHYPIASIRDISTSGNPFSRGPWNQPLLAIDGHELTLNDIEHRILRPIWNDSLIHYAVNCASVGCPNLQPDAFTAATAASQLRSAANGYVNDPRGVRVGDDGIRVSSIYDWFQEDFGGSEAGVLAHLARNAEPPLAAKLAGATSIAGYYYDWSLNDVRTAP